MTCFNIISNQKCAKYINMYIVNGNTAELHITDNKSVDVCITIDTDDVDRLAKCFWTFNKTGKNRDFLSVYSYNNRKKVYLHSYLLNIENERGYHVIFRNRNSYDYRKENLVNCKVNEIEPRTVPRKDKKNELPTGIYIRRHSNGTHTGYFLNLPGNNNCRYFGIKQYKTLENCLREALLERDRILKEVKNRNQRRENL